MNSRSKSTASLLISMVALVVFGNAAYADEKNIQVDVGKLPQPHVRLGNNFSDNAVSVILDPRCSYCKGLYKDMKDDKTTKYNVYINSFLESVDNDEYIHAIYCSEDRKSAVADAFEGRHVDAAYNCDLTALNELREFIREYNLSGSPIAISSNGDVIVGYKVKSRWM